MIRRCTILLLVLGLVAQLRGQEMTYEQAKQRLKSVELPKYWVGDVAGLSERFSQLKKGDMPSDRNQPRWQVAAFGYLWPARVDRAASKFQLRDRWA